MPIPPSQTLPQLLEFGACAHPDREALVAGPHRRSYGELAEESEAAGAALRKLGLGPGSVLALLAPNIAEWIPVAVGAMRCGARVDAFNTWAKPYDIEYLLTTSGASVLVLVAEVRDRGLLDELRALIPEVDGAQPLQSSRFPALRHIVVIGDQAPAGAVSWSALMENPSGSRADESEGGAAAFVVYTSGSTSRPKAVPLIHRDLIVNGFHIGERMGLNGADRVWFGSPLFWSYGCANALMATFTHGACLVLQEQFAPDTAAELMATERVTAAYLLPTMVNQLARKVAHRVRALDSLRTGLVIGGPETIDRAAIDLGITGVCNVYGSTETYGNCCVTDHRLPLERRRVTQGEPLPGMEVRIVDPDTHADLPIGESGEAQVRGRITPGYLNDDAANADTFTPDGWFRTGDRLTRNADGSVSFIDRTSDMIKTSGINISPAEVESFLATHPDVREVLVVGAPHPAKDEVAVAFVIPRSDDVTAPELIRYCRDRVASYKVPYLLSLVPDLPRTDTGKLVRRGLRDEAAALVAVALAAKERISP